MKPTAVQWQGADRAALERWAEQFYPREACGLLLGRGCEAALRIECALLARNLASEPARFEVHPADIVAAQAQAHAAGLELLGVWHSHADAPAEPSAHDAAAAWPGWIHVIVRVDAGRASDVTAWAGGG